MAGGPDPSEGQASQAKKVCKAQRKKLADALKIKQLEARVAELEAENRRLKKESEDAYSLDLTNPKESISDSEAMEEEQVVDPLPGPLPGPSTPGENIFLYDSHFHLDRLLKKGGPLGIQELLDLEILPPPTVKGKLSGGVAVFCDPWSFPSFDMINNIVNREGQFKVVMGIHPAHANINPITLTRAITRIDEALKAGKLNALGEMGLDFTKSATIGQQEAL